MEEGAAGTGPALAEAIQAAEWEAAQHHAHVHVTRIPARYVKGCDGDMEEAARRWKETLAWCVFFWGGMLSVFVCSVGLLIDVT